MFDIKLTTCAPSWPWSRQTGNGQFEWGPFRFHVDKEIEHCDAWVVFESLSASERVFCSSDKLIFVAGEPDSIGKYQQSFLNQFSHVISGRYDLNHSKQIRMQQGHPWFVEKNYDELLNMSPVMKTKDIVVISSDKAFTDGHRSRLEFVEALEKKFGSRIEIWGRGIRDFDSKWSVLAPYKYAIVLENFSGPDFLTEKLPDALLAYCYPIYFGCTNVDKYFNSNAYECISIFNSENAFEKISNILLNSSFYDEKLEEIIKARKYYLENLQFFANLSNILQFVFSEKIDENLNDKSHVLTAHPNSYFLDNERSNLESNKLDGPPLSPLGRYLGDLFSKFK